MEEDEGVSFDAAQDRPFDAAQDRPFDAAQDRRIIPNKNREAQICPTTRHLFDGERKRVFLEWFAGTANLSLSARAAGVHYRTVLRHRKDDPGFRADFDEALAQGNVRVKAWLMEAKDDGRTDYDPAAHAPANLTPESALQLLRDDAQREALRLRSGQAAGSAGRAGIGRPLKAVDMDEVRRQLVVRLGALGVRIEGEEGALRDATLRPSSGQASTGSVAPQDEREGEGEAGNDGAPSTGFAGPPPRPGEDRS